MEENLEHCLKCGKEKGLQGVALTIGRKTFHLFYLCAECRNVEFEEILKMIGSFKKESSSPNSTPKR